MRECLHARPACGILKAGMQGTIWILGLGVVLAAHAATLAGTATDQGGQPVAQARLHLINVVTGKEVGSGLVHGDASYAFQSVPEGSYYLRSEATNYRPLISPANHGC
jgi:hypothetical protein